MTPEWTEPVASLLSGASPAVLTTYRADGSAVCSPVWFRFHDGGFELVIAQDDPKLRQLEHRPQCSLVVFEAEPPFRGLRVEGSPELTRGDVTAVRASIAGRYLGAEAGLRFARQRATPGVLIRLAADDVRVWDLAAILPGD